MAAGRSVGRERTQDRPGRRGEWIGFHWFFLEDFYPSANDGPVCGWRGWSTLSSFAIEKKLKITILLQISPFFVWFYFFAVLWG
jgi:hypothetical protein